MLASFNASTQINQVLSAVVGKIKFNKNGTVHILSDFGLINYVVYWAGSDTADTATSSATHAVDDMAEYRYLSASHHLACSIGHTWSLSVKSFCPPRTHGGPAANINGNSRGRPCYATRSHIHLTWCAGASRRPCLGQRRTRVATAIPLRRHSLRNTLSNAGAIAHKSGWLVRTRRGLPGLRMGSHECRRERRMTRCRQIGLQPLSA